ncbi:serine/threonine-protein kinase [Streptomyces hydrogenans]|uniref:serine/threonine-protein kinase n=1 Tax=Streptomyces hydrogenans TaxID=1873719 RepID=UPI00369545C7
MAPCRQNPAYSPTRLPLRAPAGALSHARVRVLPLPPPGNPPARQRCWSWGAIVCVRRRRVGDVWDLGEGDPTEIGSFRLVARLGSGGMGNVYLATQDGRDGHVAVKTIRSEYAQEDGFRRRFTREAAAASSVRSPYTVRVVGFDTRAREPWLATEYVEGLSLRDHVRRHGPLARAEAVEMGLGLSFGLASIHRAGLVHRDLKPANVLLTDGGPKIIDFGLAYATDFSHATQSGAVLGTPGYFSPEQVQGLPVSAASDVFALGAVLTFAASGDHAFRASTPVTAQYHVVHEEPRLADVPEELRELIAACMRKDPQERPALSDVLAHLTTLRSYGHKETAFRRSPRTLLRRAAKGGESVEAAAPASPDRTGNRIVLGASAVLLLVAGAAAGVALSPTLDALAGPTPGPRASAAPGVWTSPSPDDARPGRPWEANQYNANLIDSLSYSPDIRRCVMDEGVGVDAGSMGFGISVSEGAYQHGYPTRAVVRITVDRAQVGDLQQPVVHLKLPGDAGIVSLTVPRGQDTWTFRWPDVLRTASRAEMPQRYEDLAPEALRGPYTVTLVHYSVMACDGFMGDPRGAAASPP